MKILGAEKARQIGPKMASKKETKNKRKKIHFFVFV